MLNCQWLENEWICIQVYSQGDSNRKKEFAITADQLNVNVPQVLDQANLSTASKRSCRHATTCLLWVSKSLWAFISLSNTSSKIYHLLNMNNHLQINLQSYDFDKFKVLWNRLAYKQLELLSRFSHDFRSGFRVRNFLKTKRMMGHRKYLESG